ncbi:MAG: YggS family pyridoxal phosphate-dependent enzyme [Candidatus Neomarinimicrobiota bacterium]|nr:MAG: YggS family pyridoxal phosphate-dependent enzyme [Candidatus Neomarinimicrobiota bacterium]
MLDRISRVKDKIDSALKQCSRSDTVTIVAATKTRNPKTIEMSIRNGIVDIGENRVQEAGKKFSAVEPGLVYTKRMIGHLQTNKINKAIRIFDTIDSVDTLHLAKKLANRLKQNTESLSVLLEINTGGDKTKFGFDPDNDQDLLECLTLDEIVVEGLMTIGPVSQEKESTREAFSLLRKIKESINKQVGREKKLTVLSMGMSNDFELGIFQGSTMVRLGTVLFGPREG